MVRRPRAARIVVIAHPDTTSGYALGGAAIVAVRSPDEAQAALERLVAEGERGVIAIEEFLYDQFEDEVHARIERAAAPVVVPLPTGEATAPAHRRARLAEMLQRVIGYQITFEEPSQ